MQKIEFFPPRDVNDVQWATQFFREADLGTVGCFENLCRPYSKLWPFGLVATFPGDQPFFRDPFVGCNYGFGCSVFRVDTICASSAPAYDKINRIVDALKIVPEERLHRGGRVGLYFHKGANYIVVFAGLTRDDSAEFETALGKHHAEVNEIQRTIARTNLLHVTNTQAKLINTAKISMASAAFIFDEFASKAKQNRREIARGFGEALGTQITEPDWDVAWNVAVFDRFVTWYSDCLPSKNYSKHGRSNVFMQYGDVSEFTIYSRTESGSIDVSQQAIPCVCRTVGVPSEEDQRFVGHVQTFAALNLDATCFAAYNLKPEFVMTPLGVRCAQTAYNPEACDENEMQFGPS